MDEKHTKLIEEIVTELLNKFLVYLENSKDEYEYCTVVTASVVFKELIMNEFKKVILNYNSDDNPEDICKIVEGKSVEIAALISNRNFSKKSLILN
jgi:hypothetical protein